MCTTIRVLTTTGALDCETVGDLAVALNLPTEAVSPDTAISCLCNAYVDRLGAHRATQEEGWPFPALVIDRRGG
jgi:hypothetical protein